MESSIGDGASGGITRDKKPQFPECRQSKRCEPGKPGARGERERADSGSVIPPDPNLLELPCLLPADAFLPIRYCVIQLGWCDQMQLDQAGRRGCVRLLGGAAAWPLAARTHVISSAQAQPAAPAKSPTDALRGYEKALSEFKSLLRERRAQINSNQPLPNLPGQALYLARNNMISAYKDLTDALPSKIGRSNKLAIPPAYFDADNEPVLDEYTKLFDIMQAPPGNAQNSHTPFRDVVELATAIARAKGLDAANAELAGRIGLGLFFAETNGKQNIGNGRSNTYKGSLQTGVTEDQNGQRKWAAIKGSIASFAPALIARDDKEEGRAAHLDRRFNHWTAVRDGLMNAHAELFLQIPAIAKALPNPIDQMKVFELIQIVPSPTRSALKSGNLASYRISDPTIMKYLRNNSIFTFGQVDRAKTSATFGEILAAMWLFNDKFERALAKFNEIKAERGSP